MISQILKVLCHNASCRREGMADVVSRHMDGHALLRCQNCCSTNVKIVGIDARNGERLPQTRLVAGEARTR